MLACSAVANPTYMDTYDYWQEEYNAMEEERNNLDNQLADMEIANGVKDINNFIWRLKLDNLYTKKLESFISIYLDYYN